MHKNHLDIWNTSKTGIYSCWSVLQYYFKTKNSFISIQVWWYLFVYEEKVYAHWCQNVIKHIEKISYFVEALPVICELKCISAVKYLSSRWGQCERLRGDRLHL